MPDMAGFYKHIINKKARSNILQAFHIISSEFFPTKILLIKASAIWCLCLLSSSLKIILQDLYFSFLGVVLIELIIFLRSASSFSICLFRYAIVISVDSEAHFTSLSIFS